MWNQVGTSGGVWLCSAPAKPSFSWWGWWIGFMGAEGPIRLQLSEGLPGRRLGGGGTGGPAVFFCVSLTDVLFWCHCFTAHEQQPRCARESDANSAAKALCSRRKKSSEVLSKASVLKSVPSVSHKPITWRVM